MTIHRFTAVALALGLVACGGAETDATNDSASNPNAEGPEFGGKADYFGEDDRLDPYEADVTDRQRNWARSTALFADSNDLTENDDGSFTLDTTTFQQDRQLCEEAHFSQQPTAGSCSSFLVAPDVMVTAGHCIDSRFSSCESTRFIFDYGYYEEGDDPTQVSADQVYRCKRILASKAEGHELDDLDYAVIKLQRPVQDREPLEVRQEGRARPGDHLTLIGNPDGLPTKIDARGVVFHSTETRFVATNDSFAGHSGGLVVNNSSGVVEAVHVASGGQRYVRDDEAGCYRARECDRAQIDGECQGSIGVHASKWRQHLPASSSGDAGLGDAGSSDAGSPDAGSTTDADVGMDAGTPAPDADDGGPGPDADPSQPGDATESD